MAFLSYSVPGVYQRPQPRVATFARLRTDVAGFVGVAGENHLHQAVRIDDWRSYMEEFLHDDNGDELQAPEGSMLAKAVRDFFANGGSRCWVVNAGTRIEAAQSQPLLNTMLGLADYDFHHGLELLLRQEEVSIVVLPELDANIEHTLEREEPEIPGPPCFVQCVLIDGPIPQQQLPPDPLVSRRLFTHEEILWTQRYLIGRLQRERWRWFAILATPENLDQQQVKKWRDDLTRHLGECDCAALYWPWLLTQDKPGAPVERRSPVGFMAGIFARRDLARGPHAAPANERLQAVVGVERRIDDAVNGDVYDHGINVIRAVQGHGTVIWGARTLLWLSRLSRSEPLSYINARRCLSAIERMAERIGQQAVFQPHSPLLRVQVSQVITAYLLGVYESGALQGSRAEEAFFVRCDSSNNPRQTVEQGELICEVGVALAAPAEFIEFRVGRKEGVTEIQEVV